MLCLENCNCTFCWWPQCLLVAAMFPSLLKIKHLRWKCFSGKAKFLVHYLFNLPNKVDNFHQVGFVALSCMLVASYSKELRIWFLGSTFACQNQKVYNKLYLRNTINLHKKVKHESVYNICNMKAASCNLITTRLFSLFCLS